MGKRRLNVGAGLLAKAVWQSISLSTDTLPSRASRIAAPPLPHFYRIMASLGVVSGNAWGRVGIVE
ncbi:hypothetical protein E3W21_21185 [Pseudomonas sp. F01002]|nr:hypothetical protein CUN63_23455 [Pseudomonas sp. ACM7]TFB37255.1 hypothetical protein E3W21_21185 [Pseudomonas sp. F01002]